MANAYAYFQVLGNMLISTSSPADDPTHGDTFCRLQHGYGAVGCHNDGRAVLIVRDEVSKQPVGPVLEEVKRGLY